MKLAKETYIHNKLILDFEERDALVDAYKIIQNIRHESMSLGNAEDTFLSKLCTNILEGMSEILDNYSNEYPEKNIKGVDNTPFI